MGGMGEAAASYVKGGFTLFVGSLVSFIVMAVGSILVARMLSPAEYGLYGVSFVLPSFFLLFSNWGVDTALTRFVSRYSSEGRRLEIWRLIRVGLLFNVCVGVVLSLVLFLSADFLSVLVLRRPTAGEFVRLASLLVLFQSLYSTVISVLTGLERMDLRSAVGVFQAIIKGSSSPILVYMGFGVSGPLIGQVLSYFVASVVGVLLTFRSSPRPGEASDASLVFQE
ncbi:MAG: oligosaccharide flippase family protein, partial [Candidatus Bathyarchaeota archaeon]|nr:oligosaccharide flippase family protein [Candidatus Bathyarchaeota archaeon]